jgi:hypothetical protein
MWRIGSTRMIDIVDAARMDVGSQPVVTLYGVDLVLEGRIEYPDNPADED